MTLADGVKPGEKEQRWEDKDVDVTASAIVGEDLVLELKLSPDECQNKLQFILFRGDVPMPSERYQIQPRGNVVQLTLKQSQKDDSGHYALVAKKLSTGLSISSDDRFESKHKIRLSIQDPASLIDEGEPPVFVRRLSDLAVKVGTRTRFLVEIKSSSSPKITWHKNDKPVQSGSRFSFVHEGNFYCVDVAPVMVDDQGHWTCMAENGGGRSSCTSFLTVIVPKAYKTPEFVEELRALLTETGTVSLECKVIGVPTPVLKWFKDQKEIKAGDVFALTANPDDPTSLGTYTCEAVNCMGTACSSSRVHVVGKGSREGSLKPADVGTPSGPLPVFRQILRDESCRIGDSLTLSSQVQVPPWPKSITWYNKEGRVESSDKYHLIADGLGGYAIEINGVEAMDEGEWKCVATSTENVKQFSTCHVAMAIPKNYRVPRFMESLKAVLTEEGLVSFECKVVGFPTPLLRWFKDGQELHPGDVYQLTGTNSLGSYCCIARNCMGEAKSIAELTVEDIQNQLNEEERMQLLSSNQAPKFVKGLRSCEARINEDFTFTIQVSVSPEPSLSWYRDDVPIIESEKYRLAKQALGTCNLEVKKLEFSDQAEWKCVAANDFGHSVTSCFLKLVIPKHFKKPKFLESLRAILSEEGAVNLECKVIGVPQPILKWYKDGVELKPGDIHRIISGQDGTCCLGTYTCEATNCMGSVSSSASLLGFEDRVSVRKEEIKEPSTPLHELARNLSLSTIHEERTSQLYDTPQTDHSITMDDRGEVSFSFDGKEVSVSLYETPDLTEEEALQIVEMYADQLSEHITEGNVIELPPMRFTKETSTTGNLLMEAVVIDVSPDYFVPDEEAEDLRTEADVEDVSIMDDQMLSIRSLSCVSSPMSEAPGDRVPSGSAPSRPPRRKESRESFSSRSERSDKSIPKGFDWSESYHSAKEPSNQAQSSIQVQDDSAEAFTDALSSSGAGRSKAEESRDVYASYVEQNVEKIPLTEAIEASGRRANNEEIIATQIGEALIEQVPVKKKRKNKSAKGSRTPSISSKASSEESFSFEPEVKRRGSKSGKDRRDSGASNKSSTGRRSRSGSDRFESATSADLRRRESDATIMVDDVKIEQIEEMDFIETVDNIEPSYANVRGTKDEKLEEKPISTTVETCTIDSENTMSRGNKERLLESVYKLAEPVMSLRHALINIESLVPLLETHGSPAEVERSQIQIAERIVLPVENLCEQVSAIETKALKSAGDRSLAQNVRISLLEAIGGPTEELLRGIELIRRHSSQQDPKSNLIVLESLTDPVDEIFVGLARIEAELTSHEGTESPLVQIEKPIALERLSRAVSRLGESVTDIEVQKITFGDELTSCSVVERLRSAYQSFEAFLSTIPISEMSGALENNVDTLVIETLVRPLEELSRNLNIFSNAHIQTEGERDILVGNLEKSMIEMRTRLEALSIALETYETESGEQGITELHADLVKFLRYTMDDAAERLEKLRAKKQAILTSSDKQSTSDTDADRFATESALELSETEQVNAVQKSVEKDATKAIAVSSVADVVKGKPESAAEWVLMKTEKSSTEMDEDDPVSTGKTTTKIAATEVTSSDEITGELSSQKKKSHRLPQLDPALSLPEMLLDPLIEVQANLSDVISDFESQESAEESSLPGVNELAACLKELRESVATAVHTATTLKAASTVDALVDLREPLLDLQLAMASAASPDEVKLIREATEPLAELKVIVSAVLSSSETSEAAQVQIKSVLRMLDEIEADVTKVEDISKTPVVVEKPEQKGIPKRPPEAVEKASLALAGVHFAFSTALERAMSLVPETLEPERPRGSSTNREAEQATTSNLIVSIEELRQSIGSLAVAIGTPVVSSEINEEYNYDVLFDELARLEDPLLNLQKVLLSERHGPEDRHILNDVASPIRSLKEVIQQVTQQNDGPSSITILELIEDVEKDVTLIAMEALKKALATKSEKSDDDGRASISSSSKPGEVSGIISKWLDPVEDWLTSTAAEGMEVEESLEKSLIAPAVEALKRELLKIAIQTSYSEPPSDAALIESLTELQEPLTKVCEVLNDCHEPENLDIVEGLVEPTKHLLGTILDASLAYESGKVLRPVLEVVEELENQIPLTIKRAIYERDLQRAVRSMTPEDTDILIAEEIPNTSDETFGRARVLEDLGMDENSTQDSREMAAAGGLQLSIEETFEELGIPVPQERIAEMKTVKSSEERADVKTINAMTDKSMIATDAGPSSKKVEQTENLTEIDSLVKMSKTKLEEIQGSSKKRDETELSIFEGKSETEEATMKIQDVIAQSEKEKANTEITDSITEAQNQSIEKLSEGSTSDLKLEDDVGAIPVETKSLPPSDTIEVITIDNRPIPGAMTPLESSQMAEILDNNRADQLDLWTLTLLGPLDRLGNAVLSLDRSIDEMAHGLLCRPLDSLHKQIEIAESQFNRPAGQSLENDVETIIEGFLSPVNQLHSALGAAIDVWNDEQPRIVVRDLLRSIADSSTELCVLLDTLRKELTVQKADQSLQAQQEDASLVETINAVIAPLEDVKNLIEEALKKLEFADSNEKPKLDGSVTGESSRENVGVEKISEEGLQETANLVSESLEQTATSNEEVRKEEASTSRTETKAARIEETMVTEELETAIQEFGQIENAKQVTVEPLEQKVSITETEVVKASKKSVKGKEDSMDIEEKTAKPLEELIEAIVDSSAPPLGSSSPTGYQSITPDGADDKIETAITDKPSEEELRDNIKMLTDQKRGETMVPTEESMKDILTAQETETAQKSQKEIKTQILMKGKTTDDSVQEESLEEAIIEKLEGGIATITDEKSLAKAAAEKQKTLMLGSSQVFDENVDEDIKEILSEKSADDKAHLRESESLLEAEVLEAPPMLTTARIAELSELQSEDGEERLQEITSDKMEQPEINIEEGEIFGEAGTWSAPEIKIKERDAILSQSESEMASESVHDISSVVADHQKAEITETESLRVAGSTNAPEIQIKGQDAIFSDSESEMASESVHDISSVVLDQHKAEITETKTLRQASSTDAPEIQIKGQDAILSESESEMASESLHDISSVVSSQQKAKISETETLCQAGSMDAPEIQVKALDAIFSESDSEMVSESVHDISSAVLDKQKAEITESEKLLQAGVTDTPEIQVKERDAILSESESEMASESFHDISSVILDKQKAEITESEKLLQAGVTDTPEIQIKERDAILSESESEMASESVHDISSVILDKQKAETTESQKLLQAGVADSPEIQIQSRDAILSESESEMASESVHDISSILLDKQKAQITESEKLLQAGVADSPEIQIKERDAILSESESEMASESVHDISSVVSDHQKADITETEKLLEAGFTKAAEVTIQARAATLSEIESVEDGECVKESSADKIERKTAEIREGDSLARAQIAETPKIKIQERNVEVTKLEYDATDEKLQEMLSENIQRQKADIYESESLVTAGITSAPGIKIKANEQHTELQSEVAVESLQDIIGEIIEQAVDISESLDERAQQKAVAREEENLLKACVADAPETKIKTIDQEVSKILPGLPGENVDEMTNLKMETGTAAVREGENLLEITAKVHDVRVAGRLEMADVTTETVQEMLQEQFQLEDANVSTEQQDHVAEIVKIEVAKAEKTKHDIIEADQSGIVEIVETPTQKIFKIKKETTDKDEPEQIIEKITVKPVEDVVAMEDQSIVEIVETATKKTIKIKIAVEGRDGIIEEVIENVVIKKPVEGWAKDVVEEEYRALSVSGAKIQELAAANISSELDLGSSYNSEETKNENANQMSEKDSETRSKATETAIKVENKDVEVENKTAENLLQVEQEKSISERLKKEEADRLEKEKLEKEKQEAESLRVEEVERLEKEKQEKEKREAERLKKEEAERLEKEKLEKKKQEAERLKKEEAERLEKEKLEKQNQEAERLKKEEAERLEKEKLEKEKQEAERLTKEEAERLENEKLEKEKQEAERLKKEEADRLEKEKLEKQKQEAERLKKEEAERLEKEKLEKEKQEAERLTKEEAERLENEKLEKEKQEAERLKKEEADRLEKEKLEKQKQETERLKKEEAEKLEKEKLEKQKQEAERLKKEEAERLEKEKLEQEKQEAERLKKEETERLENEKLDKEKQEAERLKKEEAERLEKEKLEKEKQEAERIKKEETERLEKEKLEKEKQEAERLKEEAERLEKEKLEKEKQEAERLKKEEAERLEKEKLEKEKEEVERLKKEEAERLEKEKLEKEKQEAERLKKEETERLEKEKLEKEKQEAERLKKEETERLEKEKLEKEKQEAERLKKEEAERLEKEKLEKEKQEAERIKKEEAERLEKEKLEKEKQEAERLNKEEAERLEKEKLEKEKQEVERLKKEEAERLEKEKLEKEKQEAERLKKEEAERLEKEKLKKEKQEAERLKKEETERLEKEKLEKEKREAERLKKEETERLEKEKLEKEKREDERLKKEEAERLEKEKLEKEKQEAERLKKEEAERLEKEKLEKEKQEAERLKKEETERLEKEKLEKEKQEAERLKKEEAERLEKEKLEKEKQEAERLKKEEAERLEKEKLEKEKQEAERIKKEEVERLEKEKLEKEKQEAERLKKEEAERLEKEKLEKEKQKAERLKKEEAERLEKEKLEKENQEAERVKKEKAERLEKEKLEKEKQEAERLKKEETERLENEKLEKEKQETERLKKEETERLEKEKLEKEKREAERLKKEEADKLEKEKLDKEKLEAERLKKQEAEKLEKEKSEKENRETEHLKKEKAETSEKEKEEAACIKKEETEKLEKEKSDKEKGEAERLKKEEATKVEADEFKKEKDEKNLLSDENKQQTKEEVETKRKDSRRSSEDKIKSKDKLKKTDSPRVSKRKDSTDETKALKKQDSKERRKLSKKDDSNEESPRDSKKRRDSKETPGLKKEASKDESPRSSKKQATKEKLSQSRKGSKEEFTINKQDPEVKSKRLEKADSKDESLGSSVKQKLDDKSVEQKKEDSNEKLEQKIKEQESKPEMKQLTKDGDGTQDSEPSPKNMSKGKTLSRKEQQSISSKEEIQDDEKTPVNSDQEIDKNENERDVGTREKTMAKRGPRAYSTIRTDSEIESEYSDASKSSTLRDDEPAKSQSRRRRSGPQAAIEVDYEVSKTRLERRERDRQLFPNKTHDESISYDDRQFSSNAPHYLTTSKIHEFAPGPRDRGKKPSFCTKLTDRTAAEGSRIKLTCTVLGDPEPYVYWTKDSKEIPSSSNRHCTTSDNGMESLEFYAASPKDSGEYCCLARNVHGQAYTEAKLKVYAGYAPSPALPTFTRCIKDTYRSAENELVLECRVRGQPSPKITWLKDGQVLTISDRYQQSDLGDGICRLKISHPDFYDSGLYTCRAENDSKISDSTSHVVSFEGKGRERNAGWRGSHRNLTSCERDTGKPRFSSYLTDHSVPAGGTIALQVEVKGVPAPDITWMRGDRREPISAYKARTFADSGVYTLIVPEATASETGTYVCRASNAYGYVDSSAEIQVISSCLSDGGKPAMFVSRPAETMIHVTVGEDVSVSFRVTGVPKPRLIWMKGLRDITQGPRSYKETSDDYVRLTLKRALVSDEGTYCIMAKNRYGCDRTFYTVKVKQRARSLTPSPDWGTLDTDSLLANIHDTERSYLKPVPGAITSEPVVVDGGRNWLALSWGKAVQHGPAPVVAYRVDAWLLGGEGGARWVELGITPVNAFDAFNLRPGGEYKFRITPRNRYGWGEVVTMKNSVTVREIVKFPEFTTILPGQLKALRGETLRLECEIRSESKADVKWYRETTDIDTLQDPRYMTHYGGAKCTMTVQSIKEHDSGRYICEATNPAGRVSTFARVQVVTDHKIVEADEKLRRMRTLEASNEERPPEFTMRLRDRRVQMTYPVRLTCQLSGHPDPEVTWYKNREEIFPDDNVSFWNDESHFHTLEISHSSVEDSGVYMAKARNFNGSVSCRCNLVVDKGIRAYVAPEFVRHLDAVYTLKLGGELRMTAQIEAYPTVGIVWHRDGNRLRPSRSAVMTLNHDGGVELSLAHVTPRDAGLYCCTATNEVGQAESTTRVSVVAGTNDDEPTSLSQSLPDIVESLDVPCSKEPLFVTKPLSTEAVEGDTVIILCEVVGDPKPEVIWLRDFLKPDYYRDAPHFRRVGAGPQYRLEIPYAKLDFTGTYSVIAKNCHGQAKAVISLQIYARGLGKSDGCMEQATIKHGNVQTLPSIKRPLRDLRCCDGDAVTLICKIHATPEPDVRWEKSGKLLPLGGDFVADFDGETARLSIQHVYPEDEGEYTCVAYNDLGKAFTSACLIVDVPEGKESALSRRLVKPIGLLSAESTPISTPRSTPIRSLSPSGIGSRRELNPVARVPRGRDTYGRRPRLPTGPKFYAVPHNRVAEEGETVRFQCAIAGHPTPWVSWDKDGVPVTPTARITLKERDDVRILEITEINHEDAGLYRIMLENDVGRTEATARLEIIKGRHGSVTRTIRTRSASPRTYSIYSTSPITSAIRGDTHLRPNVNSSMSGRGGTLSPTLPRWHHRNGKSPMQSRETVRRTSNQCRKSTKNELKSVAKPQNVPIPKEKLPSKPMNSRVMSPTKPTNTKETKKSLNNEKTRVQTNKGEKIRSNKLESTTNASMIPKRLPIPRSPSPTKIPSKTNASHPKDSVDYEKMRESRILKMMEKKDSRILIDDTFSDKTIEPKTALHRNEELSLQTIIAPESKNIARMEKPISNEEETKKTRAPIILAAPADVIALRGTKVTLLATFDAEPQPRVRWLRRGRDVRFDDRAEIETSRGLTCLTLDGVTTEQTGKYAVTLENVAGRDCCYVNVTVEGVPDPPAGTPCVQSITRSGKAIVTWRSPSYDGGCAVTGYSVEMKRGDEKCWIAVAEARHSLSHTVTGLVPEDSYHFRVRAENAHGVSDPGAESDLVTVPGEHDDEIGGQVFTAEINQIEIEEEEEEFEPAFEARIVSPEDGRQFEEIYDVLEELGKGRYGVVRRIVEKSTGISLAAKFVRTIKAKDRQQVHEEIGIMNRLRHPKLLRLAAAFENPKEMIMVTEYISGGELFERVVADDFTLTEKDSIQFVKQICEGVEYMHTHNVVHLDLKPENIMCHTRTSHRIKLIDFGLAQTLNPDTPIRVLFGTPEFIPPEIIGFEPIGTESDMWSVGVICYVLLTGLSPFMGDNDAETFANITRADYDFDDKAFTAISLEAKDFISALLVKRKELRMSAKQCLEHPWLAQRAESMSRVALPTDKLKKFIVRRKWQKTGNAIRALGRMAILSANTRKNLSGTSSTETKPDADELFRDDAVEGSLNGFKPIQPVTVIEDPSVSEYEKQKRSDDRPQEKPEVEKSLEKEEDIFSTNSPELAIIDEKNTPGEVEKILKGPEENKYPSGSPEIEENNFTIQEIEDVEDYDVENEPIIQEYDVDCLADVIRQEKAEKFGSTEKISIEEESSNDDSLKNDFYSESNSEFSSDRAATDQVSNKPNFSSFVNLEITEMGTVKISHNQNCTRRELRIEETEEEIQLDKLAEKQQEHPETPSKPDSDNSLTNSNFIATDPNVTSSRSDDYPTKNWLKTNNAEPLDEKDKIARLTIHGRTRNFVHTGSVSRTAKMFEREDSTKLIPRQLTPTTINRTSVPETRPQNERIRKAFAFWNK